MTVLYDDPVPYTQQRQQQTKKEENDGYYSSDSDKEEGYDMTEYDLDVVDDALLNPESSEYMDHFGFKIQVRTDDELSSDDDSNVSLPDHDHSSSEQQQRDEEQGSQKKSNCPNASSSTTTTTITSDDDSIDTNITTPHPSHYHHDQKWLEENAERGQYDNNTNNNNNNIPALDTTVSMETTLPSVLNNGNHSNDHQSNLLPATTSVPILKSPPSPRKQSDRQQTKNDNDDEDRHSIRSATSMETTSYPAKNEDTQRSNSIKKSTRARQSILSNLNNPFSKSSSARPSSITSLQSPSVLPRPSQSFQRRQSKRYSEAYYHHQTTNLPSRTPATNNHQNFDQLVAKFRRFSHNDHRYDSEKHMQLKEEALAELKLNKEKDETKTDWDFWETVIQDFGSVVDSQIDELRRHLTDGGIPAAIRGLIWQMISKSRDSFDLEVEYKEILKKSTSPFEKQIQRDLTRTFPDHPYFMQEANRQSLFNVAKAYSIFDQEVGYCQGLAFIIGCLLLHMPEEAAFCVLVKLMGKYGLRGHFTPRMEVLHQHMYQLDHVFQQKLPVVHRRMENEGVTPSMYASQWFITLFAYRCPIELSFRVIDLLLVEGTQVLIQIALALLIRNQEQLLKLKFEALVDFLCHHAFDVYREDGNGFVEDTYRIDLPARFMARLAQQFTMGEEARESRQSMSQEDNLRRINGQLSEHIRSVEGTLQVLQTENKELTQQIIQSKMELAGAEDEKEQLRHELGQLKAEFEQHKRNTDHERQALENKNGLLEKQLTETESMLINLKVSIAERETEFETLKRQLMNSKK